MDYLAYTAGGKYVSGANEGLGRIFVLGRLVLNGI